VAKVFKEVVKKIGLTMSTEKTKIMKLTERYKIFWNNIKSKDISI